MIPEYVVYLASLRVGGAAARSALPDAPVQPADPAEATGERLVGLRLRLGADLRRLADRLEPTSPCRAPAPAHRR